MKMAEQKHMFTDMEQMPALWHNGMDDI